MDRAVPRNRKIGHPLNGERIPILQKIGQTREIASSTGYPQPAGKVTPVKVTWEFALQRFEDNQGTNSRSKSRKLYFQYNAQVNLRRRMFAAVPWIGWFLFAKVQTCRSSSISSRIGIP
jgi:hypothetical protein